MVILYYNGWMFKTKNETHLDLRNEETKLNITYRQVTNNKHRYF